MGAAEERFEGLPVELIRSGRVGEPAATGNQAGTDDDKNGNGRPVECQPPARNTSHDRAASDRRQRPERMAFMAANCGKRCSDWRMKSGFSLARASCARSVAGKDEIEAVRNNAKLTSVMEKLTDLARGVRRLRVATERAGAGVYADCARS